MCAVGAGVAMAVGTALQQYQAGRTEEAFAKSEYEANVQRAERDSQIQQSALDQQAMENAQSVSQDRESLELETRRAISSQRASSAESGLGGVSKLRGFLATNIQSAGQEAIINTNLRNAQSRLGTEYQSVANTTSDRLNNANFKLQASKRKPIERALSAGSSGLSAGLNTYSALS